MLVYHGDNFICLASHILYIHIISQTFHIWVGVSIRGLRSHCMYIGFLVVSRCEFHPAPGKTDGYDNQLVHCPSCHTPKHNVYVTGITC